LRRSEPGNGSANITFEHQASKDKYETWIFSNTTLTMPKKKKNSHNTQAT